MNFDTSLNLNNCKGFMYVKNSKEDYRKYISFIYLFKKKWTKVVRIKKKNLTMVIKF